MSDSDKVKRKLITETSTFDPETGEELSNVKRESIFPKIVCISGAFNYKEGRFYKVWQRAIDTIDDKHMYKFIKLLTFLEGPNQRLGYFKQGEEPIPLKKIHMSRELHVDPKTIRCFIKDMIDIKGYFMFDGHYVAVSPIIRYYLN